ncbi:metallophosphoesterase family protein [Thetidibacter halocola]|nr:metallophosphoesterase family protein [Thetidibacter halocola]
MSWFSKVMSSVSTKSAQQAFDAPLAPDRAFYAVGDIHGQFHALDSLLKKIEQTEDIDPVICVGDYIDRGEHSAHVLTWLKHLTELYPELFLCLMGNHERMCLNFIDDPDSHAERWLRYGGLQTFYSFNLTVPPGESPTALRDKLVEEMGQPMIDWLRDLPLHWQSGNVVVTHAGADPDLPIDLQPERVLLWGHPEFARKPRKDGMWVVHGHTIVDEPMAQAGRIAVDTGAYATGRLTAAHVSTSGVRFVQS